jgi:hypothetical protein
MLDRSFLHTRGQQTTTQCYEIFQRTRERIARTSENEPGRCLQRRRLSVGFMFEACFGLRILECIWCGSGNLLHIVRSTISFQNNISGKSDRRRPRMIGRGCTSSLSGMMNLGNPMCLSNFLCKGYVKYCMMLPYLFPVPTVGCSLYRPKADVVFDLTESRTNGEWRDGRRLLIDPDRSGYPLRARVWILTDSL